MSQSSDHREWEWDWNHGNGREWYAKSYSRTHLAWTFEAKTWPRGQDLASRTASLQFVNFVRADRAHSIPVMSIDYRYEEKDG